MGQKNTILIVDDMEINRSLLCQMFTSHYEIMEAENGREAVEIIGHHQDELLIVLLDIVMPEMDGFGVIDEMRCMGLMGKIPVILITGDNSADVAKKGYDYGTTEVITKPFDLAIVRRRVENAIDLYRHKDNLERLVKEQTQKIEEQKQRLKEYDNFLIDTLSTVVEFRNLESGQHINRIRTITKVLLKYFVRGSRAISLSAERIDMIASASALHDIGKIAIPDSILLKPGKLTEEEFEIMKTHSVKGCEILDSMAYIQDKEYVRYSYDICRSHHERWDGRGYPDGLQGNEIPLAAQVVSIADVYDALVSERVYKPAFSHSQAIRMIFNGECGAFSPKLLESLRRAANELAHMMI